MKVYRRAGVAIIQNDKILLMHRIKNNKEYYCYPGGHPENGETLEETAIREIKEETTLDIKLDKVLCDIEEATVIDGKVINSPGRGIYYLCTKFTGTAQLSGEEKEYSCPENQFKLEWVPLKRLDHLTLYPIAVTRILNHQK